MYMCVSVCARACVCIYYMHIYIHIFMYVYICVYINIMAPADFQSFSWVQEHQMEFMIVGINGPFWRKNGRTFAIFNHLKTTNITILKKTPFFKVTKK